MHRAEPFVPEPSASEFEVAIRDLKRYKSPFVNQISDLIQAGKDTLHFEIHKGIKLKWNKEELSRQWKESLIAAIQMLVKN
jgi:hypothetical protein